jgi:formylglycine-generating enzyme required for sulfatase activity
MKRTRVSWISVGVTAVCLAGATSAGAATLKCAPDSVQVGAACIDLYEASVWRIPLPPPGFKARCQSLVNKVQQGTATLADLTWCGATQVAPASTCRGPGDYGANFPKTGNWTPEPGTNPPSPGVYAVSIPGVRPSACISWFQANQACRLSGKRLARNDEWQAAAQGTPDPGTDNGTSDCNISAVGDAVNTGSRVNCKSSWGVFDMVGNVQEWVADWADTATGCTDWTTAAGIPGGDFSCYGGPGGAGFNALPGALIRGGDSFDGTSAGVFAVGSGNSFPSLSYNFLGFRCAS